MKLDKSTQLFAIFVKKVTGSYWGIEIFLQNDAPESLLGVIL
jgi:hypothetical protein